MNRRGEIRLNAHINLVLFSLISLLTTGCDEHDITFIDDSIRVEPVLLVQTKHERERLTVFVFHARGA